MPINKITVLLADDNVEFCNAAERYLNQQEDIAVTESVHDGMLACERILLTKPDIAILDGVMPGLDGLGILEKLQSAGSKTICIMLSNILNENIINRAYELGAQYYIAKPFELEALANRIRMFKSVPKQNTLPAETPYSLIDAFAKKHSANLEERISYILHEFGIPANIRGYQYLREGIILATNDFSVTNHITKRLYPSIARTFDTAPAHVERAIRHALDVAWNRGKLETLDAFYGFKMITKEWKPTNGEFIALIADKLRLEKE